MRLFRKVVSIVRLKTQSHCVSARDRKQVAGSLLLLLFEFSPAKAFPYQVYVFALRSFFFQLQKIESAASATADTKVKAPRTANFSMYELVSTDFQVTPCQACSQLDN